MLDQYKPSLFCPPKQLPKLGSSDHYVISITPGTSTALVKNTTSTIWRRDPRQSKMREFGDWITQQNWQTVYDESLVNDKLTVLTNIMSAAVDTYLPFRKIKVCLSDKPWITTKIKSPTHNRQKALHVNGKDTEVYKAYRNAVQIYCSVAKKTFQYICKVAGLRSSNVKRWWSEINRLNGKGGSSSPWHLQMLDDQVKMRFCLPSVSTSSSET